MRRWFPLLLVMLLLPLSARAETFARIQTARGTVRVVLHADKAPRTVANFTKLATEGFYNGLTFHRVVPGFVVQGGDPAGNGSGGPGYTVAAEIVPELTHQTGTLAMARLPDSVNPQRQSSGSQFYICLAPQPSLDGAYTIFGQVVEGMEVVRQIARGDRIDGITIESR